MKVLILPGYYGFGGTRGLAPGAGSFIREQALALARSGIGVEVAYCHFDSARSLWTETRDDCGVVTHYLHAKPFRLPINMLYKMFLLSRWAQLHYLRRPPDVVHAQVFTALPHAYVISRILRVPLVYTEHSNAVQGGTLSSFWKFVVRMLVPRVSAVLPVSERLGESLHELTGATFTVVHNIVADEFFEVPLARSGDREVFHFLSVGREHPNKGWDLLLDAMRAVVDDNFSAQLTLAGAVDIATVRSMVQSRGLEEFVEIRGPVSRHQMPSLMMRSDCHVLASRLETFGMVTIESLAVGTPVIATATGAAEAIIREFNGLVVPVGDSAALADAMKNIICSRSSYAAEDIRSDAYRRFSERTFVATVERIYERSLGRT